MVQAMAKQQVRVTKVRRHVPALQDQVLKVARCLYTEDFLREASQTEIQKILSINITELNRFEDGAVVTIETLVENGVIKNPKDGVKILGNGELTKKLTVKANAFSASAAEKIQALGGTTEVI